MDIDKVSEASTDGSTDNETISQSLTIKSAPTTSTFKRPAVFDEVHRKPTVPEESKIEVDDSFVDEMIQGARAKRTKKPDQIADNAVQEQQKKKKKRKEEVC